MARFEEVRGSIRRRRLMAFYLPEEETLDPDRIAAIQRQKLAAMLAEVLAGNPFHRARLSALNFDPLRDPIDRLPLTTRDELQDDQQRHPPFGTNLTYPIERYRRLHQTSGTTGSPLRWLDTAGDWDWWVRCWSILYRAADLIEADRVLVPASFGPFIGFWGAFESAVALGMLALPAGGMTTAARIDFLLENRATVVCCTPTYALRMAEVAAERDIDLAPSPVRALIVAGEPGGNIPATRGRIETAWGARVFDHWGMTEAGPLGFECAERPGSLHLTETECIAEFIDPVTGKRLPDGDAGELVITNLGRWGSPVIRYRTGDLVRLSRDRCACGRSFAVMEAGILGRIDDMLVIRGVNVYPAAIEDILRRFPQVAEFRMQLVRRGVLNELKLEVEPTPRTDAAGLERLIADAVRDRLHIRPAVELVEPGALPRFEMKARRLISQPAGANLSR